MRKYQQLLLIVISVFSLTLLLVYRHEYNRLRYVLEVFNFFGQPCNFSQLIESGNILNHHDWGPDPVWNQEDNIYVYSTHLTEAKQLQSLIVKSPNVDHPKNCYLWFDGNEWKPEVGKFQLETLFEHDDYEGYRYKCSWLKTATPYAVSYSKKQLFKHLIVQSHNVSNHFNITMCVPPSKFLTKRYLAEFLSYHNLVAIDSFIIYSNALPHGTIKLVTNLSRQLNFNISFYTYNFPVYFEDIIEEDCKLRTWRQSKYSMVMEVNEYLVPRSGRDIFDGLRTKSDTLKLPIEKFCINEQLAKRPIALQNIYVVRDDDKMVKNVNVRKVDIMGNNEHRGLINVHQYVFCLETVSKSYEDGAILKFSDDFIKSTLFQMNLHNLL